MRHLQSRAEEKGRQAVTRWRGAFAPGLLLALVVVAAGCGRNGPPAESRAPSPPDAVAGAKASQPASKLCEHAVPAELCTRCNPDLVDVFKEQDDWCAEHALPESHCLKCNPALTFTAQAAPADWCKEHAVPESKCTKCNPRLVAKFIAAGDFCREHGYPESVCPSCHPELAKAAGQVPAGGGELPSIVRLASPETEREAGIETHRIEPGRVARSLDVVGQLDYDQNRLAQLSARGEALVVEVKVDAGDRVRAGQPLLLLASALIGDVQARLSAAEARLAAARAALERERSLVERNISPRRSLEEAESEHAFAQADRASARAALAASGASPNGGGRYELRAPFAGTVVSKDAVVGRSAAPGQVLVEVADLSVVWAQLDVPEADAGSVRAGQRVTLVIEGARSGSREGTISRVASAVNPATRTVSARVELANPGGALKKGSFVRGRIEIAAAHDALLVPLDAVQRAEGRTIVFVRKDGSSFEPVPVELG
ncbi:MAG: efflux RND transporter periplasmic adaptor subunit, partial [Acidobacteria bacterium]|nr:efflux RND transporter periplasmic adaptor subunit [Acidobacteriota bacterium]